jgi:sigma-E factor negative regulatory protein RseB
VFSAIDLPERIPDSMFKPQVDASTYRWLRADRQVASTAAPALWEAMRLPPGFRMSTRSAQAMPGSSEPVAHLVFTDGVASVSVFVEPRKAGAPAEGPARVGTSSAFSTVVDGHQVTAVGEVPPTTTEFIAKQVKASKAAVATDGLSLAPAPRRK